MNEKMDRVVYEDIGSELGELSYFTYDGGAAPTRNADELLSRKIMRESMPFAHDQFSQTPLNPEHLYESALSYVNRSNHLLGERIARLTDVHNLPEEYCDMIANEIMIEHERRCEGNIAACERLADSIGGNELDPETAELLWKALTGDATMNDNGRLLLRHPEMGSIEAAKYTKPLDPHLVRDMEYNLVDNLTKIEENHELEFFAYTEREEKDVRFIDTQDSGTAPHIIGIKDNIGEVTDGVTTIQLVRKHTAILLPCDLDLPETVANIRTYNGAPFDTQPIATSCYWRVKPNR